MIKWLVIILIYKLDYIKHTVVIISINQLLNMVETRAEAAIESKLDTVADDISDESESD